MVIRAQVHMDCETEPSAACPVTVKLEGTEPEVLRSLEEQARVNGIAFAMARESTGRSQDTSENVAIKSTSELADTDHEATLDSEENFAAGEESKALNNPISPAEPEAGASKFFLPIPDPFGKVEQWSGGRLRDPIRMIASGLRR